MSKNFCAINAKIKTIYSKLLHDEDFTKLTLMETSQDVLRYLHEKKFAGVEPYDSVYEAELKMQKYRLEVIQNLSHYLSDAHKEFASALKLEFENGDIKRILRVLQRKESIESLKYKMRVLDPRDFNLSEDLTIADFIEQLRDTKYYKILQAYQHELSDVILFYMEMNLDKFYYQSLVHASKNLSREGKRIFDELYGRKIDMLNIIWIYRGLKFYNLIPEELINFTILGGDAINFETLKHLCYTDTEEEFIEEVKKTPYAFLVEGENIDIYMNRRSNRYIYYKAKKIFSENNHFGKFLAFNMLLDFMVDDVIIVIEGLRFKLGPAETKKFLVRSYKEVI